MTSSDWSSEQLLTCRWRLTGRCWWFWAKRDVLITAALEMLAPISVQCCKIGICLENRQTMESMWWRWRGQRCSLLRTGLHLNDWCICVAVICRDAPFFAAISSPSITIAVPAKPSDPWHQLYYSIFAYPIFSLGPTPIPRAGLFLTDPGRGLHYFQNFFFL